MEIKKIIFTFAAKVILQKNFMINQQLLNPQSIVVVGGSNDITKPGGKVLKNLIDGQFKGSLYVTNPKEDVVQGIRSYRNIKDLPQVDLAILAISASFCVETVEILAREKSTKAFIILSAGFSEVGAEGKVIEEKVVSIINENNGCLIGPNCIGVLNPSYNGVFTTPIPKLESKGCDFITGSGATAVFILEAGIPKGLTFANIYSVGNSAQMGVEEILKYLDETFDAAKSSRIKLLYLEKIDKPEMLLKHSASLIRKGCKIAAIKAGSSEAGSRAASSHTGALASSDVAVEALFRKAGIVRCYGREDLVAVASIFTYSELKGENIAIITHAGGPAVMLTDELSKQGLQIPHIQNSFSEELLTKLFAGSSVSNPIDFLATGTAQQLETIIDYVDEKFDNIDGMVVIFGTPGLTPVFDAYEVLHKKIRTCQKPIFPVLPSVGIAKDEVEEFISKGHTNFPDEVNLAKALGRVFFTQKPVAENIELPEVDKNKIREIIENSENGYISPVSIQGLLDAARIPRAKEATISDKNLLRNAAFEIGFPLVMKVVGPVHKSDVGGVVLNVKTEEQLFSEFDRMMKIKDTTAILLQPMLSGMELFAGANFEKGFGHLILCGMGGIFIEVLKDVSAGLSSLSQNESLSMIRSLKSYKMIQGARGQEGVNENLFAEILCRLSALLEAAPEIKELDLNPLLGKGDKIIAVDARIRIEK